MSSLKVTRLGNRESLFLDGEFIGSRVENPFGNTYYGVLGNIEGTSQTLGDMTMNFDSSYGLKSYEKKSILGGTDQLDGSGRTLGHNRPNLMGGNDHFNAQGQLTGSTNPFFPNTGGVNATNIYHHTDESTDDLMSLFNRIIGD